MLWFVLNTKYNITIIIIIIIIMVLNINHALPVLYTYMFISNKYMHTSGCYLSQ